MNERRSVRLCVSLAGIVLLGSAPGGANTINAYQTAAEGQVDDDLCSLHEAIHEANTTGFHSGGTGLKDECQPGSSGADTIILEAQGVYNLTQVDNLPATGPNGLPLIFSTITIDGNGATIRRHPSLTTCDGSPGEFRLLFVTSFGTYVGQLTLNHVTLDNGCGDPNGGAIYVLGGSTVMINDSTISNNTAITDGGGVYAHSGIITLNRSAVVGNTAATGGGFYLWGDGALAFNRITLNNSTVSSNTAWWADPSGAAIFSQGYDGAGVLTLNNTTVAHNDGTAAVYSRDLGGGGAWVISRNSIIADQQTGDDCAGPTAIWTSAGYNIESGTSCGFSSPGDQQNVSDPGLLPLADYGGPTPSHALDQSSPAIDAGDPGGCFGDVNGDGTLDTPLSVDQRGWWRPVDGDGDLVVVCDAGSVEHQRIFTDGFESGSTAAWSNAVP